MSTDAEKASKRSVAFTMNGTEYVGKLGSNQLIAVEKELGIGIYRYAEQVGINATRTVLMFGSGHVDKTMDTDKFMDDFDEEMANGGISDLNKKALEMIDKSGALGKDKKKDGAKA